MADYDFFDLTHLPFDPPEKAAQKVAGAIEKVKKELDTLLNSTSQQLERDEITGKKSFFDSISKRIFNDGKLTPVYDKLAEDKVKKEVEKLRAVILLLKQSGPNVITDGVIRGQQKKTMLSGKNVEDVFRSAGFTVRSTADLLKKYPGFPTNADKMYAELEAFRNSKDPKPNTNGAALTRVEDLYDFAAYMAGEPENTPVYRGKSTAELKSLFDGFARGYAARTDNFGHLCSSLATAGKTYVFDSEDHRQGYEAYLRYKSPSLTRLFSQMKSFSMHQLLEPKFAEARIKEIAAVFGDYEVSLAIYNKEAGFKDEFYIPEKTEPSHTAPEPELLIPEPIFEKLPLPGPDIEDFAKYFAAAEQALREGNFEFARRSLSQAQSANPGEKNKTDELAARISAEERRKREEDARRKQEEERRKQDEEERRKREEKEEEEEKKKKEIRRDVIICIIVDAIAGAITSLIAGDTFNYFTDGNIAVNFAIIGSIFGAIIGNSFARIRYIIKDHIAFSISQIIWIGITSTTAGISGGIMGFHGHGAFGIILGIIFGIILGAILGIIIAFYK